MRLGRLRNLWPPRRETVTPEEILAMCLAVPGQIISLSDTDTAERMGRVNFGGIIKEASLAFTPEAQVGDYVIVHAGFAISQVDESEAAAALAEFAMLEELRADEGTGF